MPLRYSCRHCSATSYKRVIQRDAQGQMRPSDLYRCSGCSVVFTDPQAWRQVQSQQEPQPLAQPAPPKEARLTTGAPNFPTGWMPIPGPAR